MVQPAISRIGQHLQKHDEQLRDIYGKLAAVLIGSRLVSTVITGVVPPGSGGSGLVGSPLGVTIWQNASGAGLSQGAVVVASGVRLFTTTTTPEDLRVIGVLDGSAAAPESIVVANGAEGRVRHVGYQAVVNVVGAVSAFDYLAASSTAGRAASAGATPGSGSFALALEAFAGPGNGQIAAYVFPVGGGSGSGAGEVSYIPFGSGQEIFSP